MEFNFLGRYSFGDIYFVQKCPGYFPDMCCQIGPRYFSDMLQVCNMYVQDVSQIWPIMSYCFSREGFNNLSKPNPPVWQQAATTSQIQRLPDFFNQLLQLEVANPEFGHFDKYKGTWNEIWSFICQSKGLYICWINSIKYFQCQLEFSIGPLSWLLWSRLLSVQSL